jgi:hypothetical protein
MRTEADESGRKLRESGKSFFSDKYKSHRGPSSLSTSLLFQRVDHCGVAENLFEQIRIFFTAFADDPLNKRFGEDWKKLTKDLLLDSDGNLTFKPHLWGDLRSHILPELIKSIGSVPIPRIEYTDKDSKLNHSSRICAKTTDAVNFQTSRPRHRESHPRGTEHHSQHL